MTISETGVIVIPLVAGIASAVCYFWGMSAGKKEILDEAVNFYKVEYYLDENNNKQWRWK